VPWIALTVAVAYGLASATSETFKEVFDRARPDAADALIDLPTSNSFPSGHATTAFAAGVALAILAPRLRWPALALAAVVAYSRVYLGVHFWADILAGAALGALIGAAVALAMRRKVRERAALADVCDPSSSPSR
jgi:undecaprenyl-diphosphatase